MSVIPDYIQEILEDQDLYVKVIFNQLLKGEVKPSSLNQQRYRENSKGKWKANRSKVLKIGLAMQLYKDYLYYHKGDQCV